MEFLDQRLFKLDDVAALFADEVIVMYAGMLAERGPVRSIFDKPLHPYTQALISAVPIPDPKLQRERERMLVGGDLPSPIDPPSGCAFRTRCPHAVPDCARDIPELDPVSDEHLVACLRWRELE